jgi:5-methylcytosine-specific restriction endonuclease McrA
MHKIAKLINCSVPTIKRNLIKNNIPLRKLNEEKKWLFKSKTNPNYIHGRSNQPYALEFTDELKLEIRKRDNYICQNCEMTEEEHIIVYGTVLSIHHIDYNKQNCKKENLCSLCKQCNARVNFNRNYWKKIFQKLMERRI